MFFIQTFCFSDVDLYEGDSEKTEDCQQEKHTRRVQFRRHKRFGRQAEHQDATVKNLQCDAETDVGHGLCSVDPSNGPRSVLVNGHKAAHHQDDSNVKLGQNERGSERVTNGDANETKEQKWPSAKITDCPD